MTAPLRFGVFGAGFWTRYQLAAWREVGGAQPVAIYNRTRAKAEALAAEFGIPARAVYDDPARLLAEESVEFIDNITEVGGHKPLSLLCAAHGVPTICQKPMAPTLADAREMVSAFAARRVPFFVHENWRWQAPLRALIVALRADAIGQPFRARLHMTSGFRCWENQPALRELRQFILTDLGTHLLDVARVAFGEATSLHCRTANTRPDIFAGENVATLSLAMGASSTHVTIEMAYAGTPLEHECFPQTLAFVEGSSGSIVLAPDYWLRITTADGTQARRVVPTRYSWADPRYDISQASIVDCHRDLLGALQGRHLGETTGADNLRTLELVHAAYASAERDEVVRFST